MTRASHNSTDWVDNDTGTLSGNEMRLKPTVIAVFLICCAIEVYLLSISMGSLPLVIWLVLAMLCLLGVGLNARCLLINGPTMGMIPISIFSLAPASLAGSRALLRYSLPWWVCVVVSSISFAACAYFAWWFRKLEGAYEKMPDIHGDAILIVLGGPTRNGKPSLTVQNRLAVAAQLWREGPGRLIVVTGGPTQEDDITEAESMSRWLQKAEGVPESSIIVEPKAINTSQNLRLSLEAIKEAGLARRQICVVSSDYHLYRALAVAHRFDPEIVGIPAPVPSSTLLQQWCREVFVILSKGLI